MDMGKKLHFEIAPAPDGVRERQVTISTGDNGSTRQRTVTVASLQALLRLLSEQNVALIEIIRSGKPRSVAELARLSGRPKASLTQTLRRLERFGLVTFRPTSGRRKAPEAVCDRLTLDVAIAASADGRAAADDARRRQRSAEAAE